MGELLKYNEISKLASEIFTDNNTNLTWLEALNIAYNQYKEREKNGKDNNNKRSSK